MTLASSGTISIGGSTANRSINLELGRSATATSSLGETSLRTLAGVSSGAISLSNFHGKSNYLDQQTVTVGNYYDSFFGSTHWGDYGNAGSTSDGSCNFKSNATISALDWSTSSVFVQQSPVIEFILEGTHSNGGFTTMNVGSTSFARTNASFVALGGLTAWRWVSTTNLFGTTVGATKTVTWT